MNKIEQTFIISDVTCASCITVIEKHFKKKFKAEVNVNFATKTVYITYLSNLLNTEQIIAEFKKIGYEARLKK